jgi:hypothetical protein
MAERHLVVAITEQLKGLSRGERVAKIRKLASASTQGEKFIRWAFPDLYNEAFRKQVPGRPVRPVAKG